MSDLRQDARSIFDAAVQGVRGRNVVDEFLKTFDVAAVSACKRIFVFGAGKASASMAVAAESWCEKNYPDKFAGGLVVVKDGHGVPLKKIRYLEASHPLPDSRSEKAGEEILRGFAAAGQEDFIIFLLSGGASSLLVLPSPTLSLADKVKLSEILLKSGANIHELNALRKHCSRIKGGRLAAATPAQLLTLSISDVPGDDAADIGSGPTVADPSTLAECRKIISRYRLENQLPETIKKLFHDPKAETPKLDDRTFSKSTYHILGSNRLALKHAASQAEILGYETHVEPKTQNVPMADLVIYWTGKFREFSHLKPRGKPLCLLCGGESTLEVKGQGLGGRNMELALRLMAQVETVSQPLVFLSAGSDGSDGPTDAAGAFLDETSAKRAKSLQLDLQQHLSMNDSYPFFEKLDDLLKTGPTETNVMDLQILLVS